MVFYNGKTEAEDEVILRLSDSFNEEHRSEADVEVRVRMLNVNYGRNRALMEACKPLDEYSWFIARIRENLKNHSIVDAMKRAVDEMPEDFAIREILIVNRRNHYAKHNLGWFRRLAADEGGGITYYARRR